MLLRVFYQVWRTSNFFKRIVLEEIYIAINLDRPHPIPEIQVVGMDLDGNPPYLANVRLCSNA